jgi:Zn-dependent protease
MPSLAWFFPVFEGLLLGLISATFHEIGHLLAARAIGVNVKTLGFTWKGMYMVREPGPPEKNLVVSLAGPIMNIALLSCWHWSPAFGLANLCFAFCNLLPIQNSDGDRAWTCWRAIRMERNTLRRRPVIAESTSTAPKVGRLVSQSPQTGD